MLAAKAGPGRVEKSRVALFLLDMWIFFFLLLLCLFVFWESDNVLPHQRDMKVNICTGFMSTSRLLNPFGVRPVMPFLARSTPRKKRVPGAPAKKHTFLGLLTPKLWALFLGGKRPDCWRDFCWRDFAGGMSLVSEPIFFLGGHRNLFAPGGRGPVVALPLTAPDPEPGHRRGGEVGPRG